MRCLFSLPMVLSLLLSGCGAFSVSAFTNFGIASGTVSIVRVTIITDGHGDSTTVTIVTLLQLGSGRDWTFCGSQVSQFPINSFVTVNYNPGTSCATLISVAVG